MCGMMPAQKPLVKLNDDLHQRPAARRFSLSSQAHDESWLTNLRDLEGNLNANTSFFQGGQVAFDAIGLELIAG